MLKRFKIRRYHNQSKYKFSEFDYQLLIWTITTTMLNFTNKFISMIYFLIGMTIVLLLFRYLHLFKRCYFCQDKIEWGKTLIRERTHSFFKFKFKFYHPDCYVKFKQLEKENEEIEYVKKDIGNGLDIIL